MVVQCQTASRENIHTSNIWTQVIVGGIYVYTNRYMHAITITKEAMNLKERRGAI